MESDDSAERAEPAAAAVSNPKLRKTDKGVTKHTTVKAPVNDIDGWLDGLLLDDSECLQSGDSSDVWFNNHDSYMVQLIDEVAMEDFVVDDQ